MIQMDYIPKLTKFDHREKYEEKIKTNSGEFNSVKDLIEELSALCYKQELPFFVAVCTSNETNKTTYELETLSPALLGYTLANDNIAKFMALAHGCNIVTDKAPEYLDMDKWAT